MKILHCIHSPKIGGIERLVVELAIAQKKQGLGVTIMLNTRDGQYYDYLISNEIPVINSGITNGFDFSFRKLNSLRKCFKRFDIIHLHGFVLLQSIASIPFFTVYTIHGLSKGVRKENRIKYCLRETLKRYFLNRVNVFIANSNFTMELAKAHYGLKHVPRKVILNGIILPEFYKGEQEYINETFTVGMISRFIPRKRIDRLVDAFQDFINKGGGGRLLLVGDGITFREIAQKVHREALGNIVDMPGYSTRVEDYYRSFDICVFPSEKEPFGLVAVEAFLFGKPVLAFSDSGGLKEVIEPIEPENILTTEAELTDRMLFYYNNRDKIVQGANDRINYARKHFSIERMEREYFDVYQNIMPND